MGEDHATRIRVPGAAPRSRALASALLEDSSGQAITEYILLLLVVLGGAIALSKGLMASLDKLTLALGAELEKDLKTGRAPVSVFRN